MRLALISIHHGASKCIIPPDIVYMHMDLNHVVRIYILKEFPHRVVMWIPYEQIHFTGLFLPWHRWYVHFLESVMKTKCGFSGASPYWNWSSGLFLDPLMSDFFSCWPCCLFLTQTLQTYTARHYSRTRIPSLVLAVGVTLPMTTKFPQADYPTSIYPTHPRILFVEILHYNPICTSVSRFSRSRSWRLIHPLRLRRWIKLLGDLRETSKDSRRISRGGRWVLANLQLARWFYLAQNRWNYRGRTRVFI